MIPCCLQCSKSSRRYSLPSSCPVGLLGFARNSRSVSAVSACNNSFPGKMRSPPTDMHILYGCLLLLPHTHIRKRTAPGSQYFFGFMHVRSPEKVLMPRCQTADTPLEFPCRILRQHKIRLTASVRAAAVISGYSPTCCMASRVPAPPHPASLKDCRLPKNPAVPVCCICHHHVCSAASVVSSFLFLNLFSF